jgi:hypothetical protein
MFLVAPKLVRTDQTSVKYQSDAGNSVSVVSEMMRTIKIGLVAGLMGLPSMAFAQVINPNPTLIQFGTLQAVGSNASVSSYRGQFVDRGRNNGVRDRPRSADLEPVNVRLGAFTLRPTLDFDAFQTDNAKRASTNGQSDSGYTIRPRMSMSSNWSRHAVEFGAGVASTVYQDFSSEDATELELQASGRLDIRRGANLQAAYRYYEGAESRSTAGLPVNVAEPGQIQSTALSVGGVWELTRTRLSANLDVSDISFDPVPLTNGTLLSQIDRNSEGTTLTARADFALSPSTAVFASGTYGTRNYQERTGGLFPSRDSDQNQAMVGVNFDLSNLARGEVAVGYLAQNFDATLYDDSEAFGYRAAVEWFPSTLVTVGLVATRNITDSPVQGSGSAITTGFGGQVDWDVRSNLVLSARAQREIFEYDNVIRRDERTNLTASGALLLTKWLSVVFNVTNEKLDTNNAAGLNFEETRYGVRVSLRR